MSTRGRKRIRTGRIALALSGGVALVAGAGALVLTRPFADPAWEEAPPHPESIYRTTANGAGDGASVPVLSPFHLGTDPMKGLLLANFEQDPDRVYVGIEPQAFDDEVHGRGLLVIGWRVDGMVDVFHDPGLRLDPDGYGIAGKGLHAMVARSFEGARFELGPAGAQVDLAFDDLEGREIRLLIRETDTRPRRPFALLAPMGSAAAAPPALPLVFVNDFYFVRQAGTEVRIEIDGRAHRGDAIPLVLDGTRVHFLRYSSDPFIATWNPTADGAADILELTSTPTDGVFEAEARGVRYEVRANGEFHEIRSMSRREGTNEVVVEFSPALPHLLALREGIEVAGAFRISTLRNAGAVTGSWRVERRDGELRMSVVPDGGWTPGEAPRMARVLYRMVPMFRTWPTTYLWTATLEIPPADRPVSGSLPLRSEWTRVE